MAAAGGIVDKLGGIAQKGLGMVTGVLKQVMGKLKGGGGGAADPTQLLSKMTDLLKGGGGLGG